MLVTEYSQIHSLAFKAFHDLVPSLQPEILLIPLPIPHALVLLNLRMTPCPYPSILGLWTSSSVVLESTFLPSLHSQTLPCPFKASPKYHLLLEAFPDSQPLVPPTSRSSNSLFPEITQHRFFGSYYFLSCPIIVYIDLISPARPQAH